MDDQAIRNFIVVFIEKLGITADAVDPAPIAAHRMYNIRTSDSKRLIGPRGEHLRALNFLIRRHAERNPDLAESKFLVDVNGYQMGRIRDLESKARILADRVRTFRSSAEMTPMNSYERMLIHALFSDDPEIVTESEGTGAVRHVVFKYRS